jgi:rhodanese-related sulfurtransferase
MALPETNLITIEAYNKLCISGKNHIMIDVRNSIQYNMLSFQWYMNKEEENLQFESLEMNTNEKRSSPGSAANSSIIKDCVKVCHFPLSELKKTLQNNGGVKVLQGRFKDLAEVEDIRCEDGNRDFIENLNESVYVICRRGIDSVFATQLLLKNGFNAINVVGGLTAWHDVVDKNFPMY